MRRVGVGVAVLAVAGCGGPSADSSASRPQPVVARSDASSSAADAVERGSPPTPPADAAQPSGVPITPASSSLPPPPTISGPHGYRCGDVVAGEPVIRTVTQPRQIPLRPILRHVRVRQPIAPRRPDQDFCMMTTLTGRSPSPRITAQLFSGSLRVVMTDTPTGRRWLRSHRRFPLNSRRSDCNAATGDIEVHQEVRLDAAADAYTVTLWSVSNEGRREISSLHRGEVSEWGQQDNRGMLCAPRYNLWLNAVTRDSELLAHDILFAHPDL